jgi:hypothetical protein
LPKIRFFKFEHRGQPLLNWRSFVRRVIRNFGAATALILFSLLVGMIGYHFFEDLNWIDAYANASMILSGMGPLDPPKTDGGKIFAGTYALYSGLAVLVAAGILFTPVFHRVLHEFHLDGDDAK